MNDSTNQEGQLMKLVKMIFNGLFGIIELFLKSKFSWIEEKLKIKISTSYLLNSKIMLVSILFTMNLVVLLKLFLGYDIFNLTTIGILIVLFYFCRRYALLNMFLFFKMEDFLKAENSIKTFLWVFWGVNFFICLIFIINAYSQY